MTDKLQEVLQKQLTALDRGVPDYLYWVKCYQALKAVFIPLKVERRGQFW